MAELLTELLGYSLFVMVMGLLLIILLDAESQTRRYK
jgi:hypothetical protein